MNRILTHLGLIAICVGVFIAAGPGTGHASPAGSIRVGAVFPLRGSAAPLAREQYRGVQIAAQMVNAAGGVGGRRITLDTRDLEYADQSRDVMNALRRSGVTTVLGAYSSGLSIPASRAAAADGMVYWEAGAVADRLTGAGLPTVFRVGASGSVLGTNSARFAAEQLAPRLHAQPSALHISVVHADDAYATSVADAVVGEARSRGMHIVSNTQYDAYAPDWAPVLRAVKAAHPDILVLASHIPDGIAFRRAVVRSHIYVKAFIGSTMAQCVPNFGKDLGRDALGVFGSDRPDGGFNMQALSPSARSLFNRFAAIWKRQTGQELPSEEGLSGFVAGWVLFHDVLPPVARRGSLSPSAIVSAARSLDLPYGSLPNGAGVRFALDRGHLGQNVRAAGVVEQWQNTKGETAVWPALYAEGPISMVPLPR